MKLFNNYEECLTWVKSVLAKGYILVPSDFNEVYGYEEDLPNPLDGIYFVYKKGYYEHILEIVDGICVQTRVNSPKDKTPKLEEFLNNKDAICFDTYNGGTLETHQSHSYIDLGLPSGNKWATEDISDGYYHPSAARFAWGEIKLKSVYSAKTALKRTKFADIKASPKMDAARVIWEGKWRIPTIQDFEELINLCEWKRRGFGYKIVGPNGNSIYLNNGHYWTCISKEGEDSAACFHIGKDDREICWKDSFEGLPIRPVFSKEDEEYIESFKNDPNAEEYCRGVVSTNGKFTEKFVFVGEQNRKGGNRATAKGFIKTGDIVDVTFLGASEEPIRLHEWNPIWEMEDTLHVMGENFFFKIVVNGKAVYIAKCEGYRYTEASTMGGGIEYDVTRTQITESLALSYFDILKNWLQAGAKRSEWNFIAKESEVLLPIPQGLPHYPEPEDTTPDAPIGEKCVVLRNPQTIKGVTFYGKIFHYEKGKIAKVATQAARQVIAAAYIDSAQYLDWQEDRDMGDTIKWEDYVSCSGEEFAIFDIQEVPTNGVNKDGVIVDESLYKKWTELGKIEWKVIQ